MYRRLTSPHPPLHFTFEGHRIEAASGETVAAALLVANVGAFRETPASAAPRTAFCMMGTCFDCLVRVDGVSNCQACMTPVREGMVVERQRGAA